MTEGFKFEAELMEAYPENEVQWSLSLFFLLVFSNKNLKNFI